MLAMFYAEMLALGFEKPRSLSLSMIAVIEMFYKVASSSLKTIPRLALKREIFHHFQMDTKLDSYNVSRALQITFRKMLKKEDIDILFPFIFEHFPQAQIIKTDLSDKSEGRQKQEAISQHPTVERITTILQRGDWPLLIGPVGVGKTSAVQAAMRSLKEDGQEYEMCQVNLSCYSSNELFGWEMDGKRYSGILSNFLDQTSKPMLIILQAPVCENVAHLLAEVYDSNISQQSNNDGGSNKPNTPHRFVLEASRCEMVPLILLARCSIITISKDDEDGLSKLFPPQWQRSGKWSTNVEALFTKLRDSTKACAISNNDDLEERRMTRQTFALFKLMVGNENDDSIAANCLVSSYCWSFGVSCEMLNDPPIELF